jgi:adenylosuccinate synthase
LTCSIVFIKDFIETWASIGIRMADLLEKETFERRLKENIEVKNAYFKGMFNETCV